MEWKIVVDTSSNLREMPDLPENIEFEYVPFYLQVDEETVVDDADVNLAELFDRFKAAEQTASACPSPQAFAEAFTGAKNIICITITSNLSGSYNSAVNGRQLALEQNPEQNIFILDSRTAGGEVDLLAEKAAELIQETHDFEQVVAGLKAYHEKTDVVFILKSVDNLVTNGRVSRLVGSVVGLLNLRLIGTRTPEGTIELSHRVRGNKRGIKKTIAEMESRGYQGGRVVISEHESLDYAQDFEEALLKKYPEAAIEMLRGSALCAYYAERGGVILGFDRD